MATNEQIRLRQRFRDHLYTQHPTPSYDFVLAGDIEEAADDLEEAREIVQARLRYLKIAARQARRRGWSLRTIAAFAGVSNVAIHQWLATNPKGNEK